jgi:hypothetical protein
MHFVLHLAVGTRVQIFNFRNSHLPHILILNIQIFFFVDFEDVSRVVWEIVVVVVVGVVVECGW